ncbi:carboxypeptidase S [Ramaria rubella]|nr:carboxypeptidase S [Ramaria rubella]
MSLSMKEKADVLPTAAAPCAHRPFWRSRLVAFTSLAALWGTFHLYAGSHGYPFRQERGIDTLAKLCPQTDSLFPVKHADLYEQLGNLIDTDDYKLRAIDWLGGAVQIPTESFDLMGPIGEDKRWEAFAPFHSYLLEAFPLVHANLELTKVNTYGLVYHWQGSNPDLKPLLLTAHQDVVPVDPKTVDQWVHPPYSGYFDGTYLWGRGSADDKSGLISSISTVETLIEKGFIPTRSVVLAYGFDEETSGLFGAQQIGNYLLEKYGENSFAMLVDEGSGYGENFGQIVAVPAVGEKGYVDVRVEVGTPGGHSSIPPPHTSIGILSSLLVVLESNPLVPHIGRTQPTYSTLQCLAAHAPDMPKHLRKDILRSKKSNKALRRVEEYIFPRDISTKALVSTTQAIDLISGGVKTNALPEQAAAVVNHRIATDSSVDAVKQRVTTLLAPLAFKHNLSLTSFGNEISSDKEARYGTLKLTDAWGTALEPAPITPTDPDAAPYKLLSGSIKSSLISEDSNVIVAPGVMSGNTDTRYYWKLTPHIFRYGHRGAQDAYGGIHTINEAIKISGILKEIKFFATLILNSDEAAL